MKALILAAGLGTRLGPLTANIPKCMLSVDGQPLLERLVRWVRAHGITHVAVNLHYHPEVITAHLGDGSRFGVQITYSHEETLLGTAGAVKQLAPFFADEPFVVVYGDGYTDLDLTHVVKLHAARRQPGQPHMTMVLFHVPNPSACGIVELDADNTIARFVEKPAPDEVFSDLASAGVLVCEPSILDLIPDTLPSDFGRDVLPLLLERSVPVYGEPLADDELLIDIGTPAAFERACAHARAQTFPEDTSAITPVPVGAAPRSHRRGLS